MEELLLFCEMVMNELKSVQWVDGDGWSDT